MEAEKHYKMKNLINSVLILLLLQGCTAVTLATKYWPRDHDPALASAYVTAKLDTEKLSCADKSKWDTVIYKAEWLNEYAKFRSDPQAESTQAIVDNLNKGRTTQSEKACDIWLDLVKQRLIVLNKAWSGR
jgi:hypothetical protein